MSEPDAHLTNCHRTMLRREWIGSGGIVNWIMLNPSTADDHFDDPTIRKCRGFASRWGYRAMVVTNLFTFRATDPAELKAMVKLDYSRAVGVADGPLIKASREASLVVAAWGIHGNTAGRAEDVLNRVLPEVQMFCIGRTKANFPLHPVMARYTDWPLPFRIPVMEQEAVEDAPHNYRCSSETGDSYDPALCDCWKSRLKETINA